MKAVKSIFLGAVTFLTIQSTAYAQSKPGFCQIHAGNLSKYVSQYNMFNHSAPTPYRPFIQNSRPYNVNKELIAKPLYYVGISDGTVGAAFQLKGKYGNRIIGNKDVVVQHIKYYPTGSYVQIVGFCINGTFAPVNKVETYTTLDLPLDTQSALQEASLGVVAERTGSMFK
jgi:hypothetical protein